MEERGKQMSIGKLNTSFDDWTGRQNDHGLKILRLVSLHPPAYAAKCVACGCETTVGHLRIATQQCKNSVCGKPVRKPSRLDRERAAARERERQEEQNALRLAELRMAEETQGYTMPAKLSVIPGNSAPMSERERLAMRQRREELEAQEAAAREERERPVRELTRQLNETHRKIAALERQRLTDPKTMDVDFWHDPECDGMDFLTSEGIAEWNLAHFRNFAQNHPEFAITDKNLKTLNDYFAKHHVLLFTHEMVERLYRRMIAAGIRFDGPEAEPKSQKAVPYDQRPQANLSIAPPKPQKLETPTYKGWDEDGNEREFTEREVSRWSGDEMKRRLRLTAASGALELPTIGPGPRGSRT